MGRDVEPKSAEDAAELELKELKVKDFQIEEMLLQKIEAL